MPITLPEVTLPQDILDLIDERLVTGDTDVFVTKMNNYMLELEEWSAANVATITSFKAFADAMKVAVEAIADSVYVSVTDFTGNAYPRVRVDWEGYSVEFVAKSGADLTVDPRTQLAAGPTNWQMRIDSRVPPWFAECSAYYVDSPGLIVRVGTRNTSLHIPVDGSTQASLEDNPTLDGQTGWLGLSGTLIGVSAEVTPAISGIGYTGQTLTVTNADDFEDGFTGQWQAGGVDVSGETGLTMVVPGAHNGAAFTYDKNNGGTIATSNTIHHWTIADTTSAMWIDVAVPSSVTEAAGVLDQVDDLSGNARHLVYDPTEPQPEYDSANTAAGGLPAIVMVQASRFADTASFASAALYIVTAYGDGTTTPAPGRSTLAAWGSNNPRIRVFDSATIIENDANAITTTNYVNGSTVATTNLLPMPLSLRKFEYSTETDTVSMLCDPTGSRSWRGVATEIVMMPSAPTSAIDKKIEGYLMWKNGLTPVSGHLYESAPPTA